MRQLHGKTFYFATVQQLEKEGAKAISIQSDDPVVFEDESYVMGERGGRERERVE